MIVEITEWLYTSKGRSHQLSKVTGTGLIRQSGRGSAIVFGLDVTNGGPLLCDQGYRSIEIIILMWPFISQPCSPKPYIIPHIEISKEVEEEQEEEEEEEEKAGRGGRGGGDKRPRGCLYSLSPSILQTFIRSEVVPWTLEDDPGLRGRSVSIMYSLGEFADVHC